MATRNRRVPEFGRIGAVILALSLTASSALPFGNQGDGGFRDRMLRIRTMDMLVINYGSTNWYDVTSSLAAHPGDPDNTAVMSVFLSIGNVHLNRFERDGDSAHLGRALVFFEWVVANHGLWGERQGSGSVVSYLDISVRRLQKECDVGDYGIRIDALANQTPKLSRLLVPFRELVELVGAEPHAAPLEAKSHTSAALGCIDVEARAEAGELRRPSKHLRNLRCLQILHSSPAYMKSHKLASASYDEWRRMARGIYRLTPTNA